MLDFYSLHRLRFIFSLTLDGLNNGVFFVGGTQSLMQEKKADLEVHGSVVVGRQCRLRGELRSMFYFLGAKVTTQRITRHDRTCEKTLTSRSHKHKEQVLLASLLPLLYQVLFFLLCLFFLLLSTFGNTHRGAEPKRSSGFNTTIHRP